MKRPQHPTRATRGFAVLEALLAASALALGLLAAARLAERAWQASAHSRTLAQAQLLASQALDCVLAQPQSASLSCPAQRHQVVGPTAFEVQLEYSRLGPGLQEVWVQVRWLPAGSAPAQELRWGTRVSDLSGPVEGSATGWGLGVSSGP